MSVYDAEKNENVAIFAGMTLRDYFAGQALIGINFSRSQHFADTKLMAQWAYEEADAMLKAREVRNG